MCVDVFGVFGVFVKMVVEIMDVVGVFVVLGLKLRGWLKLYGDFARRACLAMEMKV